MDDAKPTPSPNRFRLKNHGIERQESPVELFAQDGLKTETDSASLQIALNFGRQDRSSLQIYGIADRISGPKKGIFFISGSMRQQLTAESMYHKVYSMNNFSHFQKRPLIWKNRTACMFPYRDNLMTDNAKTSQNVAENAQ